MHIVQVCKGRCDFAGLESTTREHTIVGTMIRSQMSHRHEPLFWLRERSIFSLKGPSIQHHGHSATEISYFSE